MGNKAGEHFVRHALHRTVEQSDALMDELREIFGEMARYDGRSYPRNETACQSRYGACPFLGVCTGIETLDSGRFVHIGSANPELGSSKEVTHASSQYDSDEYADCPI